MTDQELLRDWDVSRIVYGNGRDLAHALDKRTKDLQEQLDIATEQLQVACDRAQSWKNLCEHWKELAEARGEALALRDKRGPCGMRHHAADCDCGGVGGDR